MFDSVLIRVRESSSRSMQGQGAAVWFFTRLILCWSGLESLAADPCRARVLLIFHTFDSVLIRVRESSSRSMQGQGAVVWFFTRLILFWSGLESLAADPCRARVLLIFHMSDSVLIRVRESSSRSMQGQGAAVWFFTCLILFWSGLESLAADPCRARVLLFDFSHVWFCVDQG